MKTVTENYPQAPDRYRWTDRWVDRQIDRYNGTLAASTSFS